MKDSRSANQKAISQGMKFHWARRRAKYGNKITVVDGVKFASKKEAKRYGELTLLWKQGRIGYIVVHPRFQLVVNGELICTYVADFRYLDRSAPQPIVVEDVKGTQTEAFKIKWKLAQALYPNYEWKLT